MQGYAIYRNVYQKPAGACQRVNVYTIHRQCNIGGWDVRACTQHQNVYQNIRGSSGRMTFFLQDTIVCFQWSGGSVVERTTGDRVVLDLNPAGGNSLWNFGNSVCIFIIITQVSTFLEVWMSNTRMTINRRYCKVCTLLTVVRISSLVAATRTLGGHMTNTRV